MRQSKRKKLEANGWKVGSADEFLGLSPEESIFVALKLSLSQAIRRTRKQKRLTQKAFAERIKSSQSRVAKMEAGDSNVTVDLMLRSLIALGASQKDVAKAIANRPRTAA